MKYSVTSQDNSKATSLTHNMEFSRALNSIGNQIVNLSCALDLCKSNDDITKDYTCSHEIYAAMKQALDYMVKLSKEYEDLRNL